MAVREACIGAIHCGVTYTCKGIKTNYGARNIPSEGDGSLLKRLHTVPMQTPTGSTVESRPD